MTRFRPVIVLVLAVLVAALVVFSTREPKHPPANAADAPAVPSTLEVGDHVVVVREAGADTFEAAFTWPVGFRDDPDVCHALHAWWERTAARRAVEETRGVKLEDPKCRWTEVTLTLKAPATELATAVPILLGDLERGPPPPAAAEPTLDEQVQSFVLWTAITSSVRGDAVVHHALFGPRDRAQWFPQRGDRDEAAIAASLRRLARGPVDVAFTGPHDLADVTAALDRPRDPEPPAQVLALDDERADVYLWTDERMAIDLLITHGPYTPDDEALYALFTHWIRTRVDAATGYLPRADKEYFVRTSFAPSLWESGQNLLMIHVSKRKDRPLDVPHLLTVLRGVITLSTLLTDDEWRALTHAVSTEAAESDADGLTRARHVADGVRRGLRSAPDEIVRQQLPTVPKTDFEAFLQQVSDSPITIVAGGVDGVTPNDFPPDTTIVSVATK